MAAQALLQHCATTIFLICYFQYIVCMGRQRCRCTIQITRSRKCGSRQRVRCHLRKGPPSSRDNSLPWLVFFHTIFLASQLGDLGCWRTWCHLLQSDCCMQVHDWCMIGACRCCTRAIVSDGWLFKLNFISIHFHSIMVSLFWLRRDGTVDRTRQTF